MTLWLLITTSILLVPATLLVWNVYLFRPKARRRLRTDEPPMVSVLVPARNEEQTIERCVSSLLRQAYPNFEVIVIDDNSTDGTRAILARLAAHDSSLRVVTGRELPAGWVGKCYACHQLSGHARGAWLLFTDADTVHEPTALRDAVELAAAKKADLLTVIPHQVMGTFGEKLILPLLHFSSFAFLPFYALEHLRSEKFSIGIGQFMLFKASAYAAIGGHEAVRHNIVEDVWLARKIKAHGLQLIVADGSPMVSCRMYRRWSDVWNGFSKNIFAGFNFSVPAMAAVMTLYAILFVAPFVLLPAGMLLGVLDALQIRLLAVQIGVNYAMRTVLAVRFRLGIVSTLLHPFGVLGVIAIAMNSWRWIAVGGGARWKDRVYQPLTAAEPAARKG